MRKNNKKISYIISFRKGLTIFMLSIMLLLVRFHSNQVITKLDGQNKLISSVIHETIFIDGNGELDAFPNKTGSGTLEDPYVIEDLEINAMQGAASIEIRNTNKPLHIQHCTLINSSTNRAGLFIHNSQNITIINCTLKGNQHGIYLNESAYNTIWRNNASYNIDLGIYIKFSENLNISENIVSYNDDGIYLSYSE